MNTENKILSSLSYLSAFFMPIIFPIIVIALTSSTNRPEAHRHAISAFWLHLGSAVLLPVTIFTSIIAATSSINNPGFPTISFILFGIVAVLGLILLALFIYNIYRGVKVLVN